MFPFPPCCGVGGRGNILIVFFCECSHGVENLSDPLISQDKAEELAEQLRTHEVQNASIQLLYSEMEVGVLLPQALLLISVIIAVICGTRKDGVCVYISVCTCMCVYESVGFSTRSVLSRLIGEFMCVCVCACLPTRS